MVVQFFGFLSDDLVFCLRQFMLLFCFTINNGFENIFVNLMEVRTHLATPFIIGGSMCLRNKCIVTENK